MIIKNLRQLFFLFMENRFAKQHPTDPLSRSPELLLHITVPPVTPLQGHITEMFFIVHEVVEDVVVPHKSKSFHDIQFQCLYCLS